MAVPLAKGHRHGFSVGVRKRVLSGGDPGEPVKGGPARPGFHSATRVLPHQRKTAASAPSTTENSPSWLKCS